jgi:1-acyl-sn-glycerol-3-phosphate acyltransferase
VLAGNHPSAIDPVIVGGVYGRPILFLAVDELYGTHRMLDFALRAFGALKVKRQGVPLRAMRTALGYLGSGGVVGVFPEGTRVPVWGTGNPKPGAAWLAVRAGVPLVPVALLGTADAYRMDLSFGNGAITMSVGPPLAAEGAGRPAVSELMGRWEEWIERRLARG